jgi:hypothetical protein
LKNRESSGIVKSQPLCSAIKLQSRPARRSLAKQQEYYPTFAGEKSNFGAGKQKTPPKGGETDAPWAHPYQNFANIADFARE